MTFRRKRIIFLLKYKIRNLYFFDTYSYLRSKMVIITERRVKDSGTLWAKEGGQAVKLADVQIAQVLGSTS